MDPYSEKESAEGIGKLLTQPELAEKLVRLGKENVKRFSWEKSARRLEEIIERGSWSMKALERYEVWRRQVNDPKLLAELNQISGNEAEIQDRFYQELGFGTGGLRGMLGVGTNRMNVYTVARASQGYSNYLMQSAETPSVAIAYDSRNNSALFARTAAEVFAANGIQVYIYPKLMPTPSLSFAVRDLKCSGGIVITASHNPAKYNGYKVYSSDGCQITTQTAKSIQAEIDQVNPFRDVEKANFDAMLTEGKIKYIGEDTVGRYLSAVQRESLLPKETDRDVSIVYTPLNGTGISCVPRCLEEQGFINITIPDEQKEPDGNFPTCPYPNPEVKEAFQVGFAWAERLGSELLLATDPDCDRVGAAVKGPDGYTLISGNEMGVLLFDFVCKMRIKNGTMPENPVAVKTIVTTPMAAKVAEHYGVQLIDVLTGFKFIGEQIRLLEKEGQAQRYIFGFEESYGYLSGSFVRDKDAVNASLLICEMFTWYKAEGKSLLDVLDEMYQTYGYYQSQLLSFAFEGAEGFGRMSVLIEDLREEAPKELARYSVTKMTDYLRDDTGLPKSNVLRFWLEGGVEVVIRPSGTEPKLKIYLTAAGKDRGESREIVDKLSSQLRAWAGR